MKKFLTIFLILLVIFISVGCSSGSKREKVANDFISAYYKQYEYRDKLIELRKNEISNTKVEEYINIIFGELLTENAKNRLISNRIIPKWDIIYSNVNNATVSNMGFTIAKNEIEGTLSYSATIIYELLNGEKVEGEISGLIMIIDDKGTYKVENFKIIQ
ncbi:hypothetical protein [Youngiibacter multivorans]|uniref:Lipoprotein n=1 Tax=Youngiibacter multivorans TaxID=937251 RepID=A0ABS4G8R6_9CLOT|nr:hypothetical protein [Youngiibacter multivorans]MBP1920932.1 hypothetical protein [Youngiibacter multivorans]